MSFPIRDFDSSQEAALGGSEFDEGCMQLALPIDSPGSLGDDCIPGESEGDVLPIVAAADGRRSELGALRRKYRALRLAIETEPMPFESRVFSINPTSGIVSGCSTPHIYYIPCSYASFIFAAALGLR